MDILKTIDDALRGNPEAIVVDAVEMIYIRDVPCLFRRTVDYAIAPQSSLCNIDSLQSLF